MVMINSLTEFVVLSQSYSVTVTCHLRYTVIFGNLYVLIDKERKKERLSELLSKIKTIKVGILLSI